tara:strand:+ start:650 stop:1351 length:702 start_codon:yes stop_codon:yes gene_type:complete
VIKKNKNPIIILGGFLITSEAYNPTKNTIENIYDRKVYIVDVTRGDWFKSNTADGWINILNKVKDKVDFVLKETNAKKIDLIGHSSGGIMLRLYLSNEPFKEVIYDGVSITKNLITLGSPHQAVKATKLRTFVDEKYPGNFFKGINYVSIGGEVEINSKQTSLLTKLIARDSYKSISGDKNESGDGLVPLSSSLLRNSQQIILPETVHGGIFGKNWYGSTSRVKEWWDQINWR